MLWNALLFVQTVSGAVALLCLVSVGKSGPMCLIVSFLVSLMSAFPIVLLSLCPSK